MRCSNISSNSVAVTSILLLLLLSLSLPTPSSSKVTNLTVSSLSAWTVLDRFVFAPVAPSTNGGGAGDQYGSFEINAWFEAWQKITISLYYTNLDDWVDLLEMPPDAMSCNDRIKKADYSINMWESTQCTDRTCEFRLPMPWYADSATLPNSTVTNSRSYDFGGGTSHWFFVVASNCDRECEDDFNVAGQSTYGCQSPLDMGYEIVFKNPSFGTRLQHFSADEKSLLDSSIAFLSFHALLLVCMFRGSKSLKQSLGSRPPPFDLLFVAALFRLLSLSVDVGYYNRFALNGSSPKQARQVAAVLNCVSDTTTIVLTVLLSKGWCVVRRKLSANGRCKVAVFATLFFMLQLAAVVLEETYYDARKVVYVYSSGVGKIVIGVRIAALVWVHYASFTTRQAFPRKSAFYLKLLLPFSIYIVFPPLLIGSVMNRDPVIRRQVVEVGTATSIMLSHVLLALTFLAAGTSSEANRGGFPFFRPAPTGSETATTDGGVARQHHDAEAERRKRQRAELGTRGAISRPGDDEPVSRRPSFGANAGGAGAGGGTPVQSGGPSLPSVPFAGPFPGAAPAPRRLVIADSFDAPHLLRLKRASNEIRKTLAPLIAECDRLDRCLSAVACKQGMSATVAAARNRMPGPLGGTAVVTSISSDRGGSEEDIIEREGASIESEIRAVFEMLYGGVGTVRGGGGGRGGTPTLALPPPQQQGAVGASQLSRGGAADESWRDVNLLKVSGSTAPLKAAQREASGRALSSEGNSYSGNGGPVAKASQPKGESGNPAELQRQENQDKKSDNESSSRRYEKAKNDNENVGDAGVPNDRLDEDGFVEDSVYYGDRDYKSGSGASRSVQSSSSRNDAQSALPSTVNSTPNQNAPPRTFLTGVESDSPSLTPFSAGESSAAPEGDGKQSKEIFSRRGPSSPPPSRRGTSHSAKGKDGLGEAITQALEAAANEGKEATVDEEPAVVSREKKKKSKSKSERRGGAGGQNPDADGGERAPSVEPGGEGRGREEKEAGGAQTSRSRVPSNEPPPRRSREGSLEPIKR